MPSYLDNRLLSSLSECSRDILLARCVLVDLSAKKSLYAANTTPAYAYFITSGLVSIVTVMPGGATAEVGLIGCEGVVGDLHLLGPANIATECFVQLEATALRIPFASLRESFCVNAEIRDRLLAFTQEQSIILGQLAACHRLHEAEARLARWLLMAQDLTGSSGLRVTQQSLAEMLGSRRTTVTVISGNLQRRGLTEYSRGKLRILDRERLESVACDCYAITRRLTQNLYKHTSEPLPWHAQSLTPIQHTALQA